MHILILNWRDLKNPSSGGAEILTHEMAKRWTKKGHKVTQLSSRFRGSLGEEVIDGVRIIRMGTWWSVHVLVFFYYLFNLRGRVDVTIDEVHFFPFFSALYVREKTVLLACEVANKLFFEIFPYPLALIGRVFEKLYLILYKNISVLAISPSTKRALIAEGFKENNITILPMGITLPKTLPSLRKEKSPTIIFVGRLLKVKGIEDAIRLCSNLKKEFGDIKLWVVGRGEESYERKIKKLVKDLNLKEDIEFLGFVSEDKKFEMMQRAHILIAPSIKEGFGLTILEAGIVGTPAVVYNVEGLRDVVKNGINGLLVNTNINSMAEKVKNLFFNKELYEKLQQGAINYAKKLNWDNTANAALELFKKIIYKYDLYNIRH